MVKIAICVPHHGDTKAGFTQSLGGLLIHAGRFGVKLGGETVTPDLTLHMHTSSRVDVNREKLAAAALGQGAEYLLWLDADQTFPPETLSQLMSHIGRVQVVGCNVVRRIGPPTPVASIRGEDGNWSPVYTTAEVAERREVQQVDVAGFGVLLMAADVLTAIERPWFAPHPMGEDAFFYEKLWRAKIPAFVDHNLSWRVGHIGERVLMHCDAIPPG